MNAEELLLKPVEELTQEEYDFLVIWVYGNENSWYNEYRWEIIKSQRWRKENEKRRKISWNFNVSLSQSKS